MMQAISRLRSPSDVVQDPTLEPEAKRTILASWVSDCAAVEDQPALRKPSGVSEPISVDDILAALRMLDGDQDGGAPR